MLAEVQPLSPPLQRKIADIGIRMLLQEPFFGHLLISLCKQASSLDFQAGILIHATENPGLVLDESFVQLSTDTQYRCLKHELLHLLLGHWWMRTGLAQPDLFDLAADLCVEQFVQHTDEKTLLPDHFPPYKSASHYYRRLAAMEPTEVLSLLDKTTAARKSHRLWDLQESPKGARNALRLLNHQWIQAARQRTDNHGVPELPTPLTEMTEEWKSADNPPDQLGWPSLLRRFAHSANRTYISHTNSRPSKRYHTVPGLKIRHRHRILVAIDTSGSLKMGNIRRFFQEIWHIWRNGAEVYILEADYRIRNRYWYCGRTPEQIRGRGSTDFNECIEWANRSFRPDAMVYFTDGLAAAPTVKPHFPVLWLLSPEGIMEGQGAWNLLPGRKVKMTESSIVNE